ncbi:hypothetical protein [Alkalibacterium olivapovliticus]|uniref:Uncharacterized protein n=1 Tax=Alkalibacterium olivapovliticus TaxID=99907 RepID=A0A2T0W7M9_9LACT|nr:hypothetical protein [Alkalibacterium olivapovliticus]PRY82717.1 hypothetical protein CLV38_10946 [Alkalibacterium olivapovliticus]
MENESQHSTSIVMSILEWVVTLAYLNLLWIGFSLVVGNSASLLESFIS